MTRGLILYLFLEVSSIDAQRRLFEDVLGLPVAENRFHPPHSHHGVVKYDAGTMLIGLNLNRNAAFGRGGNDGLVIRLAEPGRSRGTADPCVATQIDDGRVVDLDGHVYERSLADPAGTGTATTVCGLDLTVTDLDRSASFYGDRLGLASVRTAPDVVEVQTAAVPLRLRAGPAPTRRNGYLVVFYTPDVERTCDRLCATGVRFPRGVGFSDIGGTARFDDPDGHAFCLYQPSVESLSWESGVTVTRLVETFAGTGAGAGART